MRVKAPHYCAGLVLDQGGECVEAAPILRWTIGKRWVALKHYFSEKGYEMLIHNEQANTWRVPR